MPRYKKVYESQAGAYDELVSKEDCYGNILHALERIVRIDEREIVEFGAGTGRLTRLLAPKAKFIYAFDAYSAMLLEGQARLTQLGIRNVSFALGDNKAIPVGDASADLTIAGWTFGHCTSWYPQTWKEEITSAIHEMKRVTRKSGIAVIFETLGTGSEKPMAPNEQLARYYAFLEDEFGFTRTWIRTDYRFASQTQADSLTQAFFGKTFSLQIQEDGSAILPECTGIWHLQC